MKNLMINLLAGVAFLGLTATVSMANAEEPVPGTVDLSEALLCQNICVSLEATDRADEIVQASMLMLEPEQIAKAHALANTEHEMVAQLLNSAMLNVKVAGLEMIKTTERNVLGN